MRDRELQLVKETIGPSGTTTLSIGSTDGASDIATTATSTTGANTVEIGTYFVSESATPGYDATI